MPEEKQEQKVSPVSALVGTVVVLAAIWFYFGGGLEKQTANEMRKIEQQVASDAVKQYQIAKRNGNAMDACVQAGLVSAAYLQAKDEANYQKWKATEDFDCVNAGLPR